MGGKFRSIRQPNFWLLYSGKRGDTMRRHNHGVGFQISLFQWPTRPNHVIYSENNDVSSMRSISYNSK